MEYTCTICKHSATGKALLLQHCRSVKHLQMEQLHLLQLRAEGGGQSPEIGDIFTVAAVSEKTDSSAEQENKGKDEIISSFDAACKRAREHQQRNAAAAISSV